MDPQELRSQVLPTPFVSSFIGRARPGDLADPDQARRAAAWAHWAVGALTQMTGMSERSYVAITLPGRFYDPRGKGPTVRPHLELPARLLPTRQPEFPDRLAQMGNGLLFPWWVVPEVTAVKRALFNTSKGSIVPLVEALSASRPVLIEALSSLADTAMPQWSVIEGLLVSSPDGLSGDATGDFTQEEVAAYFPAAAALGLSVVYDTKLRETSGQWASRRVGVWQIRGGEGSNRFSLGVITPRLTANSLFSDRLFLPAGESAAALLVRGLVLSRLVRAHLQPSSKVQVAPAPLPLDKKGGPYLRAIVARVGAKIPEASVEAAVHFLQTYPRPERAWEALSRWAESPECVLTVTKEGFMAAHRSALRSLRRAEDPEREDINIVLPLAWEKGRVVRVTFSRPTPEEA